ncbi:hypothetical protein [Petralouisia muris]|nr:hypothetical protein [Petralouisia muris]
MSFTMRRDPAFTMRRDLAFTMRRDPALIIEYSKKAESREEP